MGCFRTTKCPVCGNIETHYLGECGCLPYLRGVFNDKLTYTCVCEAYGDISNPIEHCFEKDNDNTQYKKGSANDMGAIDCHVPDNLNVPEPPSSNDESEGFIFDDREFINILQNKGVIKIVQWIDKTIEKGEFIIENNEIHILNVSCGIHLNDTILLEVKRVFALRKLCMRWHREEGEGYKLIFTLIKGE